MTQAESTGISFICGRGLTWAALSHGEFLKMVRGELPFGPRTGQRLMFISQHPAISNASHGSHLPSSWRTLAVLAQLSDHQFLKQLDKHPDSERKGQ